jgi:molecular chaperone HscB
MYKLGNENNPFSYFGMEPHFDIDVEKLDIAYFNGQKRYHPDKYNNKPKEQKKDAQVISSVLNLAYAELKDPILRAKSLLKTLSPQAPWVEDETYMDEEILMQMMVVRETLESAANPDEARRIVHDMKHQMELEEKNMSGAFSSKDAESLRRAITRALYVRKVLNEAERLLRRPFMQDNTSHLS